ncbi:unnamed protein product, partial [Rotaria sordida]
MTSAQSSKADKRL